MILARLLNLLALAAFKKVFSRKSCLEFRYYDSPKRSSRRYSELELG